MVEQGYPDFIVTNWFALFGLTGLEPLTHGLFWSALFNLGLLIAVSLFDRPSVGERMQATAFVEAFQQPDLPVAPARWRGTATIEDLRQVVARFVGPQRAEQAFAQYRRRVACLAHPFGRHLAMELRWQESSAGAVFQPVQHLAHDPET